MNIFKKQLVLPIVFTILVVGGFGIFYLKNSKVNSFQDITNKATIIRPSKNAPDKNDLYINKKYGFQIEYPSSVFDSENIEGFFPYENASGPWYYQKTLSSSKNEYPLSLEIYAYKYTEDDKTKPGYGPTLYFEAAKKKDNEAINQFDSKNQKFIPVGAKIYDLRTNGYTGVFYKYQEKFEDHRLGAEIYSADWLRDNMIFSVKVISKDKTALEKFRSQFEEMVESFQFIAPSN